jgi:hypothetical protein
VPSAPRPTRPGLDPCHPGNHTRRPWADGEDQTTRTVDAVGVRLVDPASGRSFTGATLLECRVGSPEERIMRC